MQYSSKWARKLFLRRSIVECEEEARKRRTFDFPVQTYLTSVRSYFEEEKWTGKSLMKNRPLDRTATVTGISKATIKWIYQTMNEDKEMLTPTKWYIKLRITINPDSFDKEVIRWTVHSFHVPYI